MQSAVQYFVLAVIIMSWNQVQAMAADAIVAKDGSGNYQTISEAVNAAPSYSSVSYYILVKSGLYEENVFIGPDKTNLVLTGDGADRTVISGSRSAVSGSDDLTATATVVIHAQGFVGQDFTIQNLAGAAMRQAVAMETKANWLTFYRCRFLGYQDTLYVRGGYQFFRDCDIRGTVDFICGDATVIFQACNIIVLRPLPGQSNTITAQKRETPYGPTGIVIHYSKITAGEDLRPWAKTYLGRPWGKYSRTVIMESFLDVIIEPEGWLQWETRNGIDPVYYAEYQNTGLGANTTSRVPWAQVISSPAEAATFTVRNFIQGDKWIPPNIPFFPDLTPQLKARTSSAMKRPLAVDRQMATTRVIFASLVFYLL